VPVAEGLAKDKEHFREGNNVPQQNESVARDASTATPNLAGFPSAVAFVDR